MAKPITPAERAAILADITAGEMSRNAIARKHGRSAGTITNIARDSGEARAFDRSATKDATASRSADLAELRSRTSARLLRKANEILDRIDEPCEVFAFGGMDNGVNTHLLDKPQSGDVRNFMTAAAIALDKHVVLDKHDNDDSGGAAVDAWLRHVMGGITAM